MDSNHAIDVDTDSELTTLHTGDTPTLDDGEHRDIMALDAAQEAHDHAEFDLIVLDTWISTPPFELPLSETLGQYWIRQRKKESTNRLARIALDMLGIPAMSSDCERVFSQAKLMITGQRHRLKPDIIEACQCLRAWLIIDRKKLGKWEGSGNWTVPYEISTGSWE